MRNPIEVWRSTRSPFRDLQTEMQRLQTRMENLMGDIVPWTSPAFEGGLSVGPRCEVSEDKNNYYFKFDMPGISKDDLKVELSDNSLTVSAERKEEKKEEGERAFISELSYGSYLRSFSLPSDVVENKIEAHLENGVLSLTVPKAAPSQAKQITIN